ncbi:helix-turn-helix domain-containing protein [Saccharopolyspora griseoalba]|uniref:Helix-turn-helix domain-containing protein n=1 Tax=Saccharopolyspora griseoalba TaxID=1431848 RepID=A0ABW2LQU4_9PSEU
MPTDETVADRRYAVGQRIRELRVQAGMTQSDVAEAAGFGSLPFYGDIERGKRNVSLDKLFAIADALGVGVGELFTDLPRQVR